MIMSLGFFLFISNNMFQGYVNLLNIAFLGKMKKPKRNDIHSSMITSDNFTRNKILFFYVKLYMKQTTKNCYR